MILIRLIACLLIAFLPACADLPDQPHSYEDYLNQKNIELPNPDEFQHCRGYGCAFRDRASLDKKELKQVRRYFKGVKSPEAEREAVAKAIGYFERDIGQKTNTADDMAGTFVKVGTHQLDCIDESTNTTIYLALLEKQNMLKYHKVSAPMSRTPLTGMARGKFWPHQTAVIIDMKSGKAYAVDSWYRDNGFPADIVGLDQWLYGWGPDVLARNP